MGTKNQAWLDGITGTFSVAVALIQFIGFQIGLKNGWPFDQTTATAMVAVALIGIATSAIAHVLKKIEARLTAIESTQAAAVEAARTA
jgi:hypothetical protein